MITTSRISGPTHRGDQAVTNLAGLLPPSRPNAHGRTTCIAFSMVTFPRSHMSPTWRRRHQAGSTTAGLYPASIAPACQRQVGARADRHRTGPDLRSPVLTNEHASMMSIQKIRLFNHVAPRPGGGSSLNSGPRFPRIRPEITSGQILDRMTECPPAPVAKSRGRPVRQDQVFLEVVSGSAWVLRIAGGNRPLPCAFSHLSFARLSNSCRSTPHDSCTSPVGGDIRVPPSGSTPRSPDFPCIRPCGAWQIPGDTTAARMNVGHVHQP